MEIGSYANRDKQTEIGRYRDTHPPSIKKGANKECDSRRAGGPAIFLSKEADSQRPAAKHADT